MEDSLKSISVLFYSTLFYSFFFFFPLIACSGNLKCSPLARDARRRYARRHVLFSCWGRRAEDAALHRFSPQRSLCALRLPVLLGCRQAVVISAVWLADAYPLGDFFAGASSASSFLAYISESITPTNNLRYLLVPLGRAASQRSCVPKGRDHTASWWQRRD